MQKSSPKKGLGGAPGAPGEGQEGRGGVCGSCAGAGVSIPGDLVFSARAGMAQGAPWPWHKSRFFSPVLLSLLEELPEPSLAGFAPFPSAPWDFPAQESPLSGHLLLRWDLAVLGWGGSCACSFPKLMEIPSGMWDVGVERMDGSVFRNSCLFLVPPPALSPWSCFGSAESQMRENFSRV